jgi:hypothetical protein
MSKRKAGALALVLFGRRGGAPLAADLTNSAIASDTLRSQDEMAKRHLPSTSWWVPFRVSVRRTRTDPAAPLALRAMGGAE